MHRFQERTASPGLYPLLRRKEVSRCEKALQPGDKHHEIYHMILEANSTHGAIHPAKE
jgi:hypothetical protein